MMQLTKEFVVFVRYAKGGSEALVVRARDAEMAIRIAKRNDPRVVYAEV